MNTQFTLLDGPCHSHEVLSYPWDIGFVAITHADYYSYQRDPNAAPLMYYQGRLVDLQFVPSRWPMQVYDKYYQLLKEGGFSVQIWYTQGAEFFTVVFAYGVEAIMFYRMLWGI